MIQALCKRRTAVGRVLTALDEIMPRNPTRQLDSPLAFSRKVTKPKGRREEREEICRCTESREGFYYLLSPAYHFPYQRKSREASLSFLAAASSNNNRVSGILRHLSQSINDTQLHFNFRPDIAAITNNPLPDSRRRKRKRSHARDQNSMAERGDSTFTENFSITILEMDCTRA